MRLKSSSELLRRLSSRYKAVWADELIDEGSTGWPYALSVGKPTRAELERGYAQLDAEAQDLRRWAERRGLVCVTEQRLVGRVSYAYLSHVQACDIEQLAHAVGTSDHLRTYRDRLKVLRATFPACDDACLRRVLVDLNRYGADDVEFDLVCRAALWFAAHDVANMTPREVPLEGFHAKWLDGGGHRSMVCALAGLDRLVLRERPRLVRYRYLDPAYLATGARAHDSWLEGDAGEPAYRPDVVVICENRDSALWFLPVEGGIAVMGDGMAGTATIANIPWVRATRQVFYWGDMDVQGFEILAKYRERGLSATSILMNADAYDAYAAYGTSVDKKGRALPPRPDASALATLTPEENALYLCLCAQDCDGPRRIEQERIPLEVAREAVLQAGC